MSYPTLPILASSTPRRSAGYEVSRATNGRLVRRRLFPAAKWDFELTHWLTEDQYATLEAHYQANQDASFAFTWADGITRTVGYTEAPLPTYSDGHVLAVVKLSEV